MLLNMAPLELKPGDPLNTNSPRESELRHKWTTIFEVLRNYVQPNSILSLAEAIDQVAANHVDGGFRGVPTTVLIDLGRQIPYNHDGHRKLAVFFRAYAKSDKWLVHSIYKGSVRLAKDRYYQAMFHQLREDDVTPDIIFQHGDAEAGDDDTMEYVRDQAFRANLMSVECSAGAAGFHDLTMFAREAMQEAFRKPRHQFEDVRSVRDAEAMGAAQWPLWAAPGIFGLVKMPGHLHLDDSEQEKALEVGDQDQGMLCWPTRQWRQKRKDRRWHQAEQKKLDRPNSFLPWSWDQWQTWKEGFRSIAGNDVYGSECRTLCGEAADVMETQENSYGETSNKWLQNTTWIHCCTRTSK